VQNCGQAKKKTGKREGKNDRKKKAETKRQNYYGFMSAS
jgi:hypothetical protein